MSSNASTTRNTVASAHARMDEFEANLDLRFNRLESLLLTIADTAVAPEATVSKRKATKAKATKPAAKKATAPKAKAAKVEKAETPEVAAKRASYGNFRNLRDALKAHKAAGAIKAGLTVAQAIEQGLMNDDGTLPGGKKAKASTKASTKAKAQTTAKVARTDVAKVVPSRRANGTIAPKGEWAIREALKAQGKSPKKVDKETAKAMAVLNG